MFYPGLSETKGTTGMSDYKPGEMDISAQEKTFAGFVRISVRVAIVSIGVLVFLAIFNS